MSTYVVTGAESGIGAATTSLLRERGHRVIGVDRTPSDITADLSTPEGRADVVHQVEEMAPEGLAGFVPCAGVAGLTEVDPRLVVSVNYFGAVDVLTGLRPLLARAAERREQPAVVVISSNSVTCQPGWASDVAGACVEHDEAKARQLARGAAGGQRLPRHEGRAGLVGPARGRQEGVDRGRDPVQRGRPGVHRHRDDRPAAQRP